MSDIIKKDPTSIDNFAGWEDGVEGDDRPQGAGIIQGTLIKFTNEATWVTRDGDELPADLELVAVDVARVVQKWQDQKPVKTIILEPHQKFPDIKKMNEETPKEEWIEDDKGNVRGPYQAQHIVYLLDLKTMDKFTYPTGTIGGAIAVGELVRKINWIRKLRGRNVHAIVKLDKTWWPTSHGGRFRPHFVARWVRLGGDGGEVEALPSPAHPTTSQPELPLNEVKEPSLAEDMNDEIPDFESKNTESPKVAAPPLPTPRRNLKKPAKTGAKKPPPKRRPPNILDAG
jgi:hypothetical protein